MIPEAPSGYRATIEDHAPGQASPHRSGGKSEFGTACPNCQLQLFPVFSLDATDERISRLGIWGRARLEVLVCPRCALYMEPYWIHYASGGATVVGGERDGGDVLLDIEWPYEERALRLTASGPEAGSEAARSTHGRPSGVCHQIGGSPFRSSGQPLSCPVCGHAMRFSGIVDYDDESVPLYEKPRSPVALAIGDRDCLNVFTCRGCDVVGLAWAR